MSWPIRSLAALALLQAGCAAWHHVPTDPRWLAPAAGVAEREGAAHPTAAGAPLRIAVYGDTRGDRLVHQRVVAAMAADRPDVVVFTGDALECLPVGHMPDFGGAEYFIPFWPHYHRKYPLVLLATLVPFPALLHDTVGTWIARPRDPAGLNAFLEDSAPLVEAGATRLFVPGNHDEYHAVDRRALGALLGRPPDQLWYSIDRGPFRFVVLDTGTDLLGDRDTMPRGGAQLTWLDEVLADAERRELHAIVAFHEPPFSSGREEGSTPWVAERLVRGVLDRHRVALVISGHAHAYERIERADPSGRVVTYLVTGGGGASLMRQGPTRVVGSKVFVEGSWHYVSLAASDASIDGRMVPVTIAERPSPARPAADAFAVHLAPPARSAQARAPREPE